MESSWREAEEISRQLTQMRQGSSVGRSGEPTGGAAVERSCEDTRDGGLADAAMAGKNVAVSDAVLRERVEQRSGDVILSDDVGEELGAVLAG